MVHAARNGDQGKVGSVRHSKVGSVRHSRVASVLRNRAVIPVFAVGLIH